MAQQQKASPLRLVLQIEEIVKGWENVVALPDNIMAGLHDTFETNRRFFRNDWQRLDGKYDGAKWIKPQPRRKATKTSDWKPSKASKKVRGKQAPRSRGGKGSSDSDASIEDVKYHVPGGFETEDSGEGLPPEGVESFDDDLDSDSDHIT